MAIDNDDAVELLRYALRALKQGYERLKIAELGDQFIKGIGTGRTLAKHVFMLLGAEHTSFDLNGRGGAEVVDLGLPLSVEKPWSGVFDLVTNFGTSEHVDSNEFAQQQCFHNVDKLCRVNGIMVHYVPHVECSKHGAYHYDEAFFHRLAGLREYRILLLDKRPKWNRRIADAEQQHDHYVRAVLQKTNNWATLRELYPTMARHSCYLGGAK